MMRRIAGVRATRGGFLPLNVKNLNKFLNAFIKHLKSYGIQWAYEEKRVECEREF